jgi:hypothetical protein
MPSQVITSSGTFTVPAHVTGSTTVQAWADGKAGSSGSGITGGAGGPGGEEAAETMALAPGTVLTITITAQGNTTVTGGTVTITAHAGTGTTGGTGSTNTVHHNGGNAAAAAGTTGGGGGSGAGTAAAGGNASGAAGGTAPAGGGNGGNAGSPGAAGARPGGGGGGGNGSSAGGASGGGQVIITWQETAPPALYVRGPQAARRGRVTAIAAPVTIITPAPFFPLRAPLRGPPAARRGRISAIAAAPVICTNSIFGQVLPAGTVSGNDDVTWDFGIQFLIAAAGFQLSGYWWYLPATGNTDATRYTFRLYTTASGTSGTLVPGSTVTGSGTWVQAAWNFTPLPSPVPLSSGTTYVAANSISTAVQAAYQFLNNYWSTGPGAGGITSGPVIAPGSAAALAGHQQPFNEPGSGTFPASVFENTFYGIDVDVTCRVTPSPFFPLLSPLRGPVPAQHARSAVTIRPAPVTPVTPPAAGSAGDTVHPWRKHPWPRTPIGIPVLDPGPSAAGTGPETGILPEDPADLAPHKDAGITSAAGPGFAEKARTAAGEAIAAATGAAARTIPDSGALADPGIADAISYWQQHRTKKKKGRQ